MRSWRFVLVGLMFAAVAVASDLPCSSSGSRATIDEIVGRVESDGVKYIFIGERHGIGPPKRFAVDLVNALVDRGYDVGLYVEGFRTDCLPGDVSCHRLARIFNLEAFSTLLSESRAPVRPLDPPERDRRAARMALTIAQGNESIRVALVGNSHVVHAENPEAELWVFGGGMKYADPGDLVEAFARTDYVTLAFEASDAALEGYVLRQDGCKADYELLAPVTGAYWGAKGSRRNPTSGSSQPKVGH